MDKTLDLDELERVAREATQGEWVSFDRDTASNIYSAGNNGSLLAVCHSYTTDVSEKRPNAARRKANATYIATFDPPTILTLIAAARRPEGSLQNLQTTPAPQPPATNWSEFEDEISDAISDSIDMDWSSRDGARAVVALLNKEAPR